MIALREFSVSDIPILRTWIESRVELLTWAGPTFRWQLDEQQLVEYASECSTPARTAWTAFDSTTGYVVGHASLKFANTPPTARLGRVLVDPAARSRGVGAQMLTQILALAFGPLDLERLDLGVFAHNTSALGLYERLGFTTDEILNNIEVVDGKPWTAVQMSQTRQQLPSQPHLVKAQLGR